MTEISFNELPQALAHLIGKVENIENLLSEKQQTPEPDENRYVDIVEIQQKVFQQWKKQTIYNKCWLNELPHSRIGGRLMFHLKECREWRDNQIQQGKIRTLSQIDNDAQTLFDKHNK